MCRKDNIEHVVRECNRSSPFAHLVFVRTMALRAQCLYALWLSLAIQILVTLEKRSPLLLWRFHSEPLQLVFTCSQPRSMHPSNTSCFASPSAVALHLTPHFSQWMDFLAFLICWLAISYMSVTHQLLICHSIHLPLSPFFDSQL